MGYPRYLRSAVVGLVAACSIGAVTGCTAHTDVVATGTAPPSVTHLWVTVGEVWFTTAADALPESQSAWTRETLSSPVVLDLASLAPGTLFSLVTNAALPAGRYRQVHLELADPADKLVAAAGAKGLEYNAQVDVTDSHGKISSSRLEFLVPRGGLTIPVDLTLQGRSRPASAGSGAPDLTTLAVTVDAARDVVTYDYGTSTGYILTPIAAVDDEDVSGAISGSIDDSGLASDHPPITVSAETVDSTGKRHAVVRRTPVAADGSFTLYPLPAAKDGGTKYDLVIACAGADTVVVRDVPVTAGAVSAGTVVQSASITLTPARIVYADIATQSPSLPGGVRVEFYQTLPGRGEVPYLIDGTAIDPLTRQLPDHAFALASGTLVAGSYASGNAISFAADTPSEGSGGYVVGTSGPYRADTLATSPVVISGTSSRPSLVSAPFPAVVQGGRSGTLSVSLVVPVGRFDSGFVTVSAGGRLVETASVDALLVRGGGTVTIDGLAAGSTLAPPGGVPYQVALRAWNSRDAAGSITRQPGTGSAILGDSGAAAVSVQIP